MASAYSLGLQLASGKHAFPVHAFCLRARAHVSGGCKLAHAMTHFAPYTVQGCAAAVK